MRMNHRLSAVGLPAAAGAVLLLLGLLATLQYRWAGELSEAERVRLRSGAKARAEALSRDFDIEITRAFVRLQMRDEVLRTRNFGAYADLYEAWAREAADPTLVKDVFLVEPAGEEERLPLSRFDADKRTFEPVDWPSSLDTVRSRAEGPPGALAPPGDGPRRPPRDRILEEIPALFLPVFGPEPRRADWHESLRHGPPPWPSSFLIVVLNPDALLSTLADRHFAGTAGLDYDLVIVSSHDQRHVRWQSRPEASLTQPDASAGLFDLRFDEVGEAERRALPRRPPAREGHGRWQLLVSHRAAPLDELVAATRRRNLAVGFGILVLLGASMALVIASALRARRLGERQMEFVAAVSHELRTPVAVICSTAENLADGVVSEPKEVRAYGSILRDQGQHLGRMVEQVLEFAGSSATRMLLRDEEVDVEWLLGEALQPFERRLHDEGFTLVRETEPGLPKVRGDAHALCHAVQNLIENAVKYDAGARWLALRADRAGAQVRITIEDRGQGIDPADLSHVFEPFFRGGDARGAGVRGFGLGLALVRRVVEGHGGRVAIESTPGRGTTFTIVLPAAPAGQPASEATDGLPHPSR